MGGRTDVEPLVRLKWDEGMADDPEVRDVVHQLDLACRHMGFFYVVCNRRRRLVSFLSCMYWFALFIFYFETLQFLSAS